MLIAPRKFRFKAWNQKTRLLMRLNTIDCVKGELFREDHILLQFTGLHDQQNEEIYEMDLLLIGKEKFVVIWDESENRWNLATLPHGKAGRPFLRDTSKTTTRLCSYFESDYAGAVT